MIPVPDSDFYITFQHECMFQPSEPVSCGHRLNTKVTEPTRAELLHALFAASVALVSPGTPEAERHETWHIVDDVLTQAANAEERYSHLTTCAIVTKVPQKVYATGHSLCTVEDNFCKETGRWYSLTRAIDSMARTYRFNRKGREAFLTAYFDRYGKGQEERARYGEWLRTEFMKADMTCPSCGRPVGTGGLAIAEASHDGTIAGDVPVVRRYHMTCYQVIVGSAR